MQTGLACIISPLNQNTRNRQSKKAKRMPYDPIFFGKSKTNCHIFFRLPIAPYFLSRITTDIVGANAPRVPIVFIMNFGKNSK